MPPVDPDNEATFKECVIPSALQATRRPKDEILKDLQGCDFCEEAIFSIKLALEEALTNAVKHGNGLDPNKSVTVRWAVDDEKMVVIIRDEGPGFEPDTVPDPTTPDRLPIPSGRGIMLMKAYMDEVDFRDRGREVRFCKHRDSGGAS